MIFSPTMFPASQLPHWLATVHQYLPIESMANLSRGTLTDLNVNLGQAFAVVGGWCLLGLVGTCLFSIGVNPIMRISEGCSPGNCDSVKKNKLERLSKS